MGPVPSPRAVPSIGVPAVSDGDGAVPGLGGAGGDVCSPLGLGHGTVCLNTGAEGGLSPLERTPVPCLAVMADLHRFPARGKRPGCTLRSFVGLHSLPASVCGGVGERVSPSAGPGGVVGLDVAGWAGGVVDVNRHLVAGRGELLGGCLDPRSGRAAGHVRPGRTRCRVHGSTRWP